MSNQNPGVLITLKDIYNLVQALEESVNKVEKKIYSIEEKVNKVYESDERSREAINLSKTAYEVANNSLDEIKTYKEERAKLKSWLSRTIVTAMMPYVISMMIGVIYILGKG